MPKWMRRYLADSTLKTHLVRALLLGSVLRLLSSWFVYGPQALDDYKHGVWPAYQFFAQLPLEIPEYRSHLLVWFLSIFIEMASWVGATSALAQVRAMYFGLGATSLLCIYATYIYVRGFRSRLFGPLALYLVAAFPLMPFVGTRAFGEAVAMPFVMLGLAIVDSVRRERRQAWPRFWFLGFLFLGLATLFRFHAGLIFVSYALILLTQRHWRGVFGAFLAGLVTLGGQALIDIGSGKAPLSTLFIYLSENEGGGAKYGVSPWYNPLLFILALSLAPFSLVLCKSLKGLWRKHWPVLTPFLVFLLAHCLVAHKEERFLYPILGLELWALAYLWSANAYNRWARKVYAPAFFIIVALALPMVTLVNTQEGEIEPPAYAQSRFGEVIYLDHASLFGKSRFQFYFLRGGAKIMSVERTDLNAHSVDAALGDGATYNAAVLLTSEPEARPQLESLEGIATIEATCGQVRTAGSLVDRLLYSLNPKHNQRRRPTWYLICERSKNV